jgi:hypothetical protein
LRYRIGETILRVHIENRDFYRRVKVHCKYGGCHFIYHKIMSGSATLIYAELLSNIRQISVIAALESPCNPTTKVELSADGKRFLLQHDGKVTTLILPGATSTSSRLQIPTPGTRELSWRLPLAERPEDPSAGSTDAPWPAKDLNENTEFLCRGCGEAVVARGRIREWKDLPSENWAEMMDFWHCHKPTVPKLSGPSGTGHSHEDPAMSRGYGANTKFIAQPKIGFVDLTTILIAQATSLNIKVRHSHVSYYPFQSLLSKVGIKKAAKLAALLLNGLVTDTHTLNQSVIFLFFQETAAKIPSSPDYGYLVCCRLMPLPFTLYLPEIFGRPWD